MPKREGFWFEGKFWERDKTLEKEIEELTKDMKFTDFTAVQPGDEVYFLEKRQTTEPQLIRCPRCGNDDLQKYGLRHGEQEYICNLCKAKFKNTKAPYRMRSPMVQIGAALSMFYDGLSLSDISRQLEQSYSNPVNPSSVYRWILRYTREAVDTLGQIRPQIGDTWVVDETVISIAGENRWFWDVIDEKTRFLLGSYISRSRNIQDVVITMERAWKKTERVPRFIISDGLKSYIDGIEQVFGADAKHIVSRGFTAEINTNLIERFHGTLKERVKVFRDLKTIETARLILDGFVVNYNFFRPHMTLKNKTPAEVAGINYECKNWTAFIKGECGIILLKD